MLTIAIVGRPNVGKSALFNTIVKKRIAIVDEHEGVTRDRLYGTSDLFGRSFQIADTGGMLSKEDRFGQQITAQAEIAIHEADAIILVVDSRVGVQALDIEVAKIVRRTKKPLVLAVNKVDNLSFEKDLYAFSSLGIQPIVAISAIHKIQIAELLEALFDQIPEHYEEVEKSSHPKIAIIGRPNAGKSLLTNTILGNNRCLVSPIAGTTRDSVDTEVSVDGITYTLIDTAGLKKSHKEKEVVEKFSTIRTERAIERADLCLLLVDSQYGVTTEEKRIAKDIERAGKGCVVALNKWDLIKNVRMEHAMKGLENEIPFLVHCPKLFISAKTGRNVEKLFPLFSTVLTSLHTRISTHKLNKALLGWMQQFHPPMIKGRRLRVYYMSQVSNHPPHFVLFVNSPHLMENSYKRYLINQLRKTFFFEGVPFVFTLRGKEKKRQKRAPAKGIDRDLSAISAVVDYAHEEELLTS